ncbi:ABC transporter ATP-binding protein [Rhodospirillum rubrum]|uniref:ABC transporter component n=1 Tax=Rhodospirillum rubrum (strain ATCC 11170 / ATH 1.1.1 / DSM 467 / LMG 4362 / NCIMB 8255 / S1) TaxID=269796 RepID=Q2RW89_RHORT|nr:ABC transporter ATP-binding protein [Rhodospirillum rubrum]ABC21606.1 ABC transporter component [Rhodospirillum rubrum ATCC 11170]AEO47293.1 ABC transporter protein [Rhodospirillum rubrum F11]QXG81276.1 ABC transporter ATP-binding protein [Rhodospirillum rubrum]HAP99753.1 ABC transporter ATP-binding protein [Rhodospirillum rubrum]HCF17377.1 ABC transporter ATP-binding protein [Rhodospirillum rubrum]
MNTLSPLLDVRTLSVDFPTRHGLAAALRGVSFSVGREKLGIVGESGSGKSTVARAILDSLPPQARVSVEGLTFEGADLRTMPKARRAGLLGRRLSMVPQDPRFGLNPVISVGRQIAESYRLVGGHGRREARALALDALAMVKIADPRATYDRYPHQLSGGMGQRVMIAMMLAPGPALLFADEPTSALDSTTTGHVLETLHDLVSARGMGLVLISHDLDLVAAFCDRILVMNQGEIVESCRAGDLSRVRHPYSRRLLAAVPRLPVPRDRSSAALGGR